MKRWITWTALGLVVVLMGWGVWRTLAARQVEKKPWLKPLRPANKLRCNWPQAR